MKHTSFPLVLAVFAASLTVTAVSCSDLKKEVLGTTGQQAAVATNTSPTAVVPPLAVQLQQAAPVVEAIAPQPYGTLIATGLNLLGSALAAFATFHARSAAASSAASSASNANTAAAQAGTKTS